MRTLRIVKYQGSLLTLSKRLSTSRQIQASTRHYCQPPSTCPSQNSLQGKKSVITGASRGIGREITTRFANEGCSCILVGRNLSLLEALKSSLPGDHEIVIGDVSSEDFWRENFRKRKDIDILVNAAGVTHASPLFVTSVQRMEEVVGTNLMGTMLGCRSVGLGMLGRRDGCIINVASLLGLKGGKGSSAYAASKAGVIAFTRALAAESGGKGIRANVIVPGYIETDMTAAMTSKARSEALNAIPLNRFGEASDIADAAVFLVTNKYANNCVLNLDGGLSAV